jgi:hypothetical protein
MASNISTKQGFLKDLVKTARFLQKYSQLILTSRSKVDGLYEVYISFMKSSERTAPREKNKPNTRGLTQRRESQWWVMNILQQV